MLHKTEEGFYRNLKVEVSQAQVIFQYHFYGGPSVISSWLTCSTCPISTHILSELSKQEISAGGSNWKGVKFY